MHKLAENPARTCSNSSSDVTLWPGKEEKPAYARSPAVMTRSTSCSSCSDTSRSVVANPRNMNVPWSPNNAMLTRWSGSCVDGGDLKPKTELQCCSASASAPQTRYL